ncbi:hypothetical protein QTP86_033390 [Hemibagrus guttatus]|nr:hypothetical protein QTP86_033390 [Hemibagrus guttatus]
MALLAMGHVTRELGNLTAMLLAARRQVWLAQARLPEDCRSFLNVDDWFVSVDLKDAYFHIPIAVHHRKFLHFSFQNQACQFKVLPFDLSLAPHVFTRSVSAALSPLWMRSMRVLPYLDDWLLCAPTRQQAMQDSKLLLRHVQLFFSVNKKKSCLIPAQTTMFIGMTLNSRLMSASLSQECVTNILQLLAHFRPGMSFALLDGPMTIRDVNGCYSGDSPRFTPPQTTTVMEQFMTQSHPTSPSTDCNFSQLHTCIEAVETGRASEGRSSPGCCSISAGVGHNRRFPHRLVGNMELEYLWTMDTYSGQRTYQSAGTKCSVHGSKVLLASPGRPPCSCLVRQYLNGVPSEPPGWHKVPQISTGYSQDPDMVSAVTCFTEGSSYFRSMQPDSRCSFQGSITSRRMENPGIHMVREI